MAHRSAVYATAHANKYTFIVSAHTFPLNDVIVFYHAKIYCTRCDKYSSELDISRSLVIIFAEILQLLQR